MDQRHNIPIILKFGIYLQVKVNVIVEYMLHNYDYKQHQSVTLYNYNIAHFATILPAIPVKAPTQKSAPGRVHGKNPKTCAHGPVFCTSEVIRAGRVPNNPPMDQLLGETMVTITCVITTWPGTRRSNEGAIYYFITSPPGGGCEVLR